MLEEFVVDKNAVSNLWVWSNHLGPGAMPWPPPLIITLHLKIAPLSAHAFI